MMWWTNSLKKSQERSGFRTPPLDVQMAVGLAVVTALEKKYEAAPIEEAAIRQLEITLESTQ